VKPITETSAARMNILTIAFFLICSAGTVQAQDPMKVAPNNFKVLLENEQVRVLDFHSTTGQKIPMHSHPAYVSYSISGSGKTRFTSADGKITEPPARTGQATWHESETHASEYIGSGTAHVLLVELKAPAAGK
jgi:quercetin dioxygenase-like cupin family protein